MSQDQVTVTLCTKELFLSRYCSPCISEPTMREGERIQIVNVTHSAVLAGFHNSKVDLNIVYKVSDKNILFCTFVY
jgi:hypothetical protein